jgi:hypothetical protein
MKKDKIIYWTATTIIALFEGVMPALTSQTELAKEGIKHLGYPEYFGNAKRNIVTAKRNIATAKRIIATEEKKPNAQHRFVSSGKVSNNPKRRCLI